MTDRLNRRDFLHRAVLAAVAWRGVSPLRWRAPVPLRIGVSDAAAGSPQGAARRAGIELGLDEARHAATLFGGEVVLVPVAPRDIRRGALAAVIGGHEPDDAEELSGNTERAGVIFMNVGCASDSLRSGGCRPSLFHVVPSDAMCRDAVAQANAATGAWAAAWDPSLERFGADTLNTRFQSRFGRPMTSDAWCGWFAVKVLWEASLRARTTTAAPMAAYLRRESTQFDGHKGRALSFRGWDGQLRQPVYVLARDGSGTTRMIGEFPAAPTGAESSRDVLDRIGVRATGAACKPS
jgi:hypothetical protein